MSITIKVIDRSAAIRSELEFLQTHEVRVGILTGGTLPSGASDASAPKKTDSGKAPKTPLTVAQVFSFHELGRGHNPKRSSIVWVMDFNTEEIAKISDKAMLAVMDGKMSGRQALSLIGEKIVSLAKRRIKSKIQPALSASRLRQKMRNGKSGEVPLIHTGQMINSLRWNIVGSI
jgi:hypothetical protein